MRTHSSTGRLAAVALAAAVVAVPLFSAAPAYAVPFDVVSSITFDDTELLYGETTQGYFNGTTTLTSITGDDICTFEYKNDVVIGSTTPTATAEAPRVTWDFLGTKGVYVGDVFTIAFAAPVDVAGTATCVAPTAAAALVKASVRPMPAPQLPVSAASISLKQGVAVDMVESITLGAGFDFSTTGGWIAATPQNSGDFENGEIYPLDGLIIDVVDENVPGVVPTLHIYGTPKYAGVINNPFRISDQTSEGDGEIVFNIASKNGTTGPISIETAVGQPVAGAKVTVIAAGLKEGAAWDVTVRSTPIVVGSGTIAFGGQLAQTVTIPAGLAAGRHSITVTSTNADGTVFSTVLYFTVSASGTLLAVSTSATELAATGADLTAPVSIGGGLLLAGLAFGAVSVYRRRRSI